MNILDLITEILTNKDYENKFNLPEGPIRFLFNLIHTHASYILLACILIIFFSFRRIYKSNTYDKNTGSTLLLIISTVFTAFCLSVSLDDLGFTIFKTIAPTAAGITALALFLQNDQKNRMELNDRHKEYRKSILIDRRNRYSEAVKLINSDREEGVVDGIRQLNSLLSDWSQDNSIDDSERNTEIDNITGKLSDTFRKHANFKVNNPSQIEENILSVVSELRGGYNPKGPKASRKLNKLWKKIDKRLYLSTSDMSRKSKRPAKRFMRLPSTINNLGNSIDRKIYKFNFRNSKINYPINLAGFQKVDFSGVDFYRSFTIKPKYVNNCNAYLIDTQFKNSTFHGSTEYQLTKFLFTSNESPFSGVNFAKSADFESCIFLSGFWHPYAFKIEESDFQSNHNSLNISDSIFYLPFFIENSSIPDANFSSNYIASSMLVSKVSTGRIYFDSCNIKSLSINQIIQVNENIPEVDIIYSYVRDETVIRGDHSAMDINIHESRFKKNSVFGDTRYYPANRVDVSNSYFSEMEISANTSVTIRDISVKKLVISVGTKSTLDISIQNILRVKNLIVRKASEIVIDGSYGHIRSLYLNNVNVKKIRFVNVSFSQIESIKLENVEYKEIKFIDCTFDSPNQKEDIKRLAGTDSGYKKIKPKTHKELIENYEYFSNLEDLGL